MSFTIAKIIGEAAWEAFLGNSISNFSRRTSEDGIRELVNGIRMGQVAMINEDVAYTSLLPILIAREEFIIASRFVEDVSFVRSLFKEFIIMLGIAQQTVAPAPSRLTRRIATIKGHDVAPSDLIVEFPKNSKCFYILDCPVCKTHFDSVSALYGHLYQAEQAHEQFVNGRQMFNQVRAVSDRQVCIVARLLGGTRVMGVTHEWVTNHNLRRQVIMDVSYPVHF
jgi:hypothetical protein